MAGLTGRQSTCYDSSFWCPVIEGTPTLRCGPACYLPDAYSPSPAIPAVPGDAAPPPCPSAPVTQHLSDPPYENFFYSDCNVDAQVVVTSPLPDSNLTIIGPRLIVAWPAGNSGVCAFFAPRDGINGSLGIELVNFASGVALRPVYSPPRAEGSQYPGVGVSGIIRFNSSAILTLPILGSIRVRYVCSGQAGRG
jgi:hypothetical protein